MPSGYGPIWLRPLPSGVRPILTPAEAVWEGAWEPLYGLVNYIPLDPYVFMDPADFQIPLQVTRSWASPETKAAFAGWFCHELPPQLVDTTVYLLDEPGTHQRIMMEWRNSFK